MAGLLSGYLLSISIDMPPEPIISGKMHVIAGDLMHQLFAEGQSSDASQTVLINEGYARQYLSQCHARTDRFDKSRFVFPQAIQTSNCRPISRRTRAFRVHIKRGGIYPETAVYPSDHDQVVAENGAIRRKSGHGTFAAFRRAKEQVSAIVSEQPRTMKQYAIPFQRQSGIGDTKKMFQPRWRVQVGNNDPAPVSFLVDISSKTGGVYHVLVFGEALLVEELSAPVRIGKT
ncbi:MAG: hypothetical protein V1800_06295 [Candidatus Latescibacterota bacterium]